MAHASCPTLLAYGAATRGTTREEVLSHVREVTEMILERLTEEGATGERIVVTVCAPLEDTPHRA